MVLGRSSEMEETLDKGRRVGATPSRASKSYGKNRVCLEKDCDQQLSMYNHKEYCFVHHKFHQPRVRGREIIEI